MMFVSDTWRVRLLVQQIQQELIVSFCATKLRQIRMVIRHSCSHTTSLWFSSLIPLFSFCFSYSFFRQRELLNQMHKTSQYKDRKLLLFCGHNESLKIQEQLNHSSGSILSQYWKISLIFPDFFLRLFHHHLFDHREFPLLIALESRLQILVLMSVVKIHGEIQSIKESYWLS